MADNFNFKNFLFENKLGAYSKAKSLNEVQIDVHPGSKGDAHKTVTLTTEDGKDYELSVLAVDEDEIEIKSGTYFHDEKYIKLTDEMKQELQREYEQQIAQAIHDMYGGDIEISRAVKRGMDISNL